MTLRSGQSALQATGQAVGQAAGQAVQAPVGLSLREQLAQARRMQSTSGLSTLSGASNRISTAPMTLREQLAAARLGQSAVVQADQSALGAFMQTPVGSRVMGGLRGLASALEPLQLPQDILFAALSGSADKQSTISERMGRIDWGAYWPGGDAPERPASGEEIFRLMGMDEPAAKWAGIAADLLVDPLVMGSWLRVGGKAMGIQELVTMGDKVDNFISPIGMIRGVNQVARRSSYISNFQDRRMSELAALIRNPSSTFLGISNFGERATRAASWVLPRDTMFRLRLGREAGEDLFRAEQAASLHSRRISDEGLTMLQNAYWGVTGDRSKDIVRSYIKTMEEQSAAWDRALGRLDPVLRDTIETSTYSIVNEQIGVGFASVVARRVDDIADPVTRTLAEDLRKSMGGFDSRVENLAQEILDGMALRTQGNLNRVRASIGELARRRGQQLKVGDLDNYERQAVAAFDDYLSETLLIDSRLGLELSGYNFISKMVKERVLELTGDIDLAEATWLKVLRFGTLGGEKGIDMLRTMSTGIHSIFQRSNLPQHEHRLKRARAAQDAVEAEKTRLDNIRQGYIDERQARRAAQEAEDAEFTAAYQRQERARAGGTTRVANMRRKALLEGADELPVELNVYLSQVEGILQGMSSKIRTSKPVANLEAHVKKMADTIDRYTRSLDDLMASDTNSAALIKKLMDSEAALAKVLQRQAELLDEMATSMGLRAQGSLTVGPGMDLLDVSRGRGVSVAGLNQWIEETAKRATDLRVQTEGMVARKAQLRQTIAEDMARNRERTAQARREYTDRNTSVRHRRREEEAAISEARSRAVREEAARRAAQGLPREGSSADFQRLAKEAADSVGPTPSPGYMPAVPLQGTNTTLDDIMAARMRNASKMGEAADLEDLYRQPITYGELLDGISDMQALKLGEFMSGLMNGHLRRAYGIFVDEGSFTRYVDALRMGRAFHQRTIDEAELPAKMAGFEHEARLIQEYHTALKSAGGGAIISRDRIVDYLKASGVSGDRISGAIRSLVRATGAGNEQFEKLMRNLDNYVPNYRDRQAMAERLGAGRASTLPVRGRRWVQEREDISEQLLKDLGEYAMASMSIAETASFSRRVVRRQDYFQRAYEAARNRGLVKNEEFIDEFGTRYRKIGTVANTIGGFGDKYVHPYLYDELMRMSQVRQSHAPAAWNRIRSLLTGGYLAAPSVIAANFFGGLYQSATAGINPAVMIRRLGEVLPDMLALGRGQRTDLIDEMRRTTTLEATNIITNEFADGFYRRVQKDWGLERGGARGLYDTVTEMYEDFLRAPGAGKMRFRFAGLDGFQFTENWFKLAAYKEMKEKLAKDFVRQSTRGGYAEGRALNNIENMDIERQAAEFARLVVFDYSTLPTSLEALKEWGVVLFPGFPYFMAGRTIGAVMNRPGTVAVADRISQAVSDAVMPIEDQVALYLGEPSWLKQEQGVPFVIRSREDESREASIIPMAQLIPTSTLLDTFMTGGFAGNPLAESLAQGGLFGPIIDIMSALTQGTGEAPITGRYGHIVFEPGADGALKAASVFRFLYNSFAPSVVRKGIAPDYQGTLQGAIPNVVRAFANSGERVPNAINDGLYSLEEHRTGRPQREAWHSIISLMLRSPQVVALDGPLAGINTEMRRERSALTAELEGLTRRYNRAMVNGETAEAQRLLETMNEKRTEFAETWRYFTEFYRAYAERSAWWQNQPR